MGGGRETPGWVISDPAGNLTDARTGERIETPSQKEAAAKASAALDSELDAEDGRRAEQLRKLGFSADETTRQLGGASLANIACELAAIRELRRVDERRYWSDDVQRREQDLIRVRESAKAEPANAEATEGEPANAGDMPGLPQSLIDEWREGPVGLERSVETARAAVTAMVDGVEDQGEAAELVQSFDELPEAARAEIFRYLAIEPGGSARSASAERIEEFADAGPACAELVDAWGDHAGRRLGLATQRVKLMLRGMTRPDQAKAEAWLDGLSPAQAAAVVKSLAGG
jgi:hypothetical protein